MKIVCIKTSIDIPNRRIMNSDLHEYLIIGTLFQVYGIRFDKGVTYYHLFNGQHLFEAPIELFDIVDDRVSNDWKVKVWSNEEVSLWPDLFYNEGFLEGFSERNIKERQMFEDLRMVIEV